MRRHEIGRNCTSNPTGSQRPWVIRGYGPAPPRVVQREGATGRDPVGSLGATYSSHLQGRYPALCFGLRSCSGGGAAKFQKGSVLQAPGPTQCFQHADLASGRPKKDSTISATPASVCLTAASCFPEPWLPRTDLKLGPGVRSDSTMNDYVAPQTPSLSESLFPCFKMELTTHTRLASQGGEAAWLRG